MIRIARFAVVLSFGVAAQAAALPQTVSFSIDWRSSALGQPDSATNTSITAGDLLQPAGGAPALGLLPTPEILISGGAGGLMLSNHASCVVPTTCNPCPVEVDAHSFGHDRLLEPEDNPFGAILFSVDGLATGHPNVTATPSVRTEGAGPMGALDAPADVWAALSTSSIPSPPPMGFQLGHVGLLDGNGLSSFSGFVYPGIGLVEPRFPFSCGGTGGDNVDSLDIVAPGTSTDVVYFSLDAGYTDSLGFMHTDSAVANGFRPGDVLISYPLTPPLLYAQASNLGLDKYGPNTDDLDALLLAENGDTVFQPSVVPFDWLFGQKDMLLFSVRRGSAIIGTPDSLQGLAIQEGDILTTPAVPGGAPAILIAAEALGLIADRDDELIQIDDLDAMTAPLTVLFDCNGNGIEDPVDIAVGTSLDTDGDGVPNECEPVGSAFCIGDGSSIPCGCGNENGGSGGGCGNSFTPDGAILQGFGTTSLMLDDLTLQISGAVPTQVGTPTSGWLLVGSMKPAMPSGDGILCLGPGIDRFGTSIDAQGNASFGPGVASMLSAYGAAAGSTSFMQFYYLDPPPAGFCGSGHNLSNGLSVTWTP